MAAPQTIEVHQYEDATLTLTGTASGSVAGWTAVFSVRDMAGALKLQISATISSAGSGSTPGVFTVAIASAQMTATLMPAGGYKWDLWRTNAGSLTPIAHGVFTVLEQQRV